MKLIITKYHRALQRVLAVAAAFCAMASLASCDSWIYEDEGDCEPHYKVKFRYDYNLKYADAFSNEVNAVTLYIVDPATGRVVWRKTESSDTLRSDGYVMDVVGIKPGNYKLMAWGGDGHIGDHFTLDDSADDHTLHTCMLNLGASSRDGNSTAVSDRNLQRLYKDLPAEFSDREFPDRQGTHVHTVRMMKNTNSITVVLQHLSGEPVDPSLFDFTIASANGSMAYDNSLVGSDTITYKPHNTRSGFASGFVPESSAQAQFSAAIADFSVCRLVKGDDMILTITRRSDGGIVARIPVIDYSLMVKGYYGDMPDQEYLDRQDHYSMVFFIDEGLRWVNSFVYINAWVIVPNDVNI